MPDVTRPSFPFSMPDASPTRRPTLKDLAREAGVSLASASYAVNGNGSVGEQTRAHILAVAQRIGYRQNVAARAMKTGRSGTLALVVPDLANPFFPALALGPIAEQVQMLGGKTF